MSRSCAVQGGHHRVQRGLAGEARQRGAWRTSTTSTPASAAISRAGHLVAGGVVGVQVDGQAHLLLQGGHQLLGGVGLQQAGHVLDGQHVGAPLLQLLGEVDIVFQGVLVLGRGPECRRCSTWWPPAACSGLRTSSMATSMPGIQFRESKTRNTSMPPLGGLLHEGPHQVVGIVGVAHQVGAAQQHLERDVGDLLPQQIAGAPTGTRGGSGRPRRRWRRPTSPARSSPRRMSATPSAPLTMSRVRIRVDSRLWWASRMVVSVSSSFFWSSTHSLHGLGALGVQQLLQARAQRLPVACGKRGMSYCLRSALGLATWISAM